SSPALLPPFFLQAPPLPSIYTLSLHVALPILRRQERFRDTERQPVLLEPRGLTLRGIGPIPWADFGPAEKKMVPAERNEGYALRSEEHTSELQSRFDLVCRLLLE